MLDENGKPIGAQRRVMEFYAKGILAYLARMRGPQSPPIQAIAKTHWRSGDCRGH
jgi:hypothetical protein